MLNYFHNLNLNPNKNFRNISSVISFKIVSLNVVSVAFVSDNLESLVFMCHLHLQHNYVIVKWQSNTVK